MVGKGNDPLWHFSSVFPHSQRRLSLFTVELTQQCNFRCNYCCFSGLYNDRRVHNSLVMSVQTMQDLIDYILDNRDPSRLTIVTFYGGETLLALENIKWMISVLRNKLGSDIGFSISSNGYLLTRLTVDWLCSVADCDLYITIDGYEKLHDLNRRTISNKPTYRRILSNLEYFKMSYPEEYQKRVNFLVTLSKWEQLPDVSDRWNADVFFKDKIPKHLSFILPKSKEEMEYPISSITARKSVLENAFERYKQGEKSLLTQLFIEWTDVIYRGMQNIQEGKEIKTITCLEDMYRTFVSAEGDIYICERFCSEHSIGNLSTGGIDFNKLKKLEDNFISRRNRLCNNCPDAQLCSLCMTSLNYNDDELLMLCKTERQMIQLLKDFAWRRRNFDREKQLINQ